MIWALVCCLFIFLGMFIGNRYDLKKLSINLIFGLFSMNCLCSMFPYVNSLLYRNYHGSTWIFIFLCFILGYLIIKLFNCKYDDSDSVSIIGFVLVNTCLLVLHKFSILYLIINILYYIFIGIYIRNSKSWIYVLVGCILGILFSFINSWKIGFVYGVNLGFVLYYVLSVYSIVFRSKDKKFYISLIIGFVVALLGGLL